MSEPGFTLSGNDLTYKFVDDDFDEHDISENNSLDPTTLRSLSRPPQDDIRIQIDDLEKYDNEERPGMFHYFPNNAPPVSSFDNKKKFEACLYTATNAEITINNDRAYDAIFNVDSDIDSPRDETSSKENSVEDEGTEMKTFCTYESNDGPYRGSFDEAVDVEDDNPDSLQSNCDNRDRYETFTGSKQHFGLDQYGKGSSMKIYKQKTEADKAVDFPLDPNPNSMLNSSRHFRKKPLDINRVIPASRLISLKSHDVPRITTSSTFSSSTAESIINNPETAVTKKKKKKKKSKSEGEQNCDENGNPFPSTKKVITEAPVSMSPTRNGINTNMDYRTSMFKKEYQNPAFYSSLSSKHDPDHIMSESGSEQGKTKKKKQKAEKKKFAGEMPGNCGSKEIDDLLEFITGTSSKSKKPTTLIDSSESKNNKKNREKKQLSPVSVTEKIVDDTQENVNNQYAPENKAYEEIQLSSLTPKSLDDNGRSNAEVKKGDNLFKPNNTESLPEKREIISVDEEVSISIVSSGVAYSHSNVQNNTKICLDPEEYIVVGKKKKPPKTVLNTPYSFRTRNFPPAAAKNKANSPYFSDGFSSNKNIQSKFNISKNRIDSLKFSPSAFPALIAEGLPYSRVRRNSTGNAPCDGEDNSDLESAKSLPIAADFPPMKVFKEDLPQEPQSLTYANIAATHQPADIKIISEKDNTGNHSVNPLANYDRFISSNCVKEPDIPKKLSHIRSKVNYNEFIETGQLPVACERSESIVVIKNYPAAPPAPRNTIAKEKHEINVSNVAVPYCRNNVSSGNTVKHKSRGVIFLGRKFDAAPCDIGITFGFDETDDLPLSIEKSPVIEPQLSNNLSGLHFISPPSEDVCMKYIEKAHELNGLYPSLCKQAQSHSHLYDEKNPVKFMAAPPKPDNSTQLVEKTAKPVNETIHIEQSNAHSYAPLNVSTVNPIGCLDKDLLLSPNPAEFKSVTMSDMWQRIKSLEHPNSRGNFNLEEAVLYLQKAFDSVIRERQKGPGKVFTLSELK